MSSARTKQPIAVDATNSARTASGVVPVAAAAAATTRSIRSPSTEPGQIALTRTPNGPSSLASVLVSPITPHLAAQ